jgi:hypothetical protein
MRIFSTAVIPPPFCLLFLLERSSNALIRFPYLRFPACLSNHGRFLDRQRGHRADTRAACLPGQSTKCRERHQQGEQELAHPLVKHPVTPLHTILWHTPAGAATAAFFTVFFAVCFLALCCGAVCAAFADGSLDDAGAASTAQAGATIKANNNSNTFFLMTVSPL